VTRRTGARRPDPSRYLATKLLTPDGSTRSPNPSNSPSQRKYSRSLGLAASTARLVIRFAISFSLEPPWNHRKGTTGKLGKAQSHNARLYSRPFSKPEKAAE